MNTDTLHIILQVVAIAALTTLAAIGKVAGADAVAVIAALAGLGAGIVGTKLVAGSNTPATGTQRQNLP